MKTKEFLHWIADRLVQVHGENENVDYVLKLREIANSSADEYEAFVELFYSPNYQPRVQVGEASRISSNLTMKLWTLPANDSSWNGSIKLLPKKEA